MHICSIQILQSEAIYGRTRTELANDDADSNGPMQETIADRVRCHLTDINSKISEEDI